MADPLDELLRLCCLRVERRGTGFFVAPRHVVTCSHVIGEQTPVDCETNLFSLARNRKYRARLTHIFPEDDLAILETETAAELPVILGPSEAELGGEEKLLIVGYPQYDSDPEVAELGGINVIYDGSSYTPGRRRVQFRANLVFEGFSGSPLLNLHTGHVVGIVIEERRGGGPLGGWAVPAETLLARLGQAGVSIRPDGATLRSWRAALDDRQEYLGPSIQFRQPELRTGEPQNSNIFSFSSRRIEFRGRRPEMEMLESFLDSSALFAWTLITGSGGSGKSRLALELCLRHGDTWRAGFLSQEQIVDSSFWREWRPNRPTLLVIDYAGAVAEAVGEMVRSLRSKKTHPPLPIRLLLIERDLREGDNREGWFDRFLGKGALDQETTLAAQFPYPKAPQLAIGPLSNAEKWAVMQSVAPHRFAESDRESVLNRLQKVDSEGRTLFAIFLAATSDATNDRIEIIRNILRHEQQIGWERVGATEEDRTLLAFATLCGGVPRSRCERKTARLDAASAQFSPVRYQMISGKSAKSSLAPLEPDILGELFALDWLANLDDAESASTLAAAWDANAEGTAGFISRAVPDFPDHEGLRSLLKPPPGPSQSSWGSVLVDLLRYMPGKYHALARVMYEEIKGAATGNRVAPAVRRQPASGGGLLMALRAVFAKTKPRREAVAAGQGGEFGDELYDLYCRATLNFILVCQRGQQFELARSLEAELEGSLALHPDQMRAKSLKARLLGNRVLLATQTVEAELAGPLNPAPLTFASAKLRMTPAQKTFDELTSLSKRGASNRDFQTQYAAAAFHLVLGYTKPGHVYSRMWAPASFMVKNDVVDQLKRGEKTYRQLRTFASSHSDPDVQSFTARAASALSAAYANLPDIDRVKRLCGELQEISSAFPKESNVRAELARALVNLVIGSQQTGDFAAAKKACAVLQTLNAVHPEETFIAERLARAEEIVGLKS